MGWLFYVNQPRSFARALLLAGVTELPRGASLCALAATLPGSVRDVGATVPRQPRALGAAARRALRERLLTAAA